MIIEYMLIRELDRKKAPSWVEDGGYFFDPDNKTLVGWSPDLKDRDYYVPDSVVILSRAELISRQLDIHSRYPMKRSDGVNGYKVLSSQEVQGQVNLWCDNRSEG